MWASLMDQQESRRDPLSECLTELLLQLPGLWVLLLLICQGLRVVRKLM